MIDEIDHQAARGDDFGSKPRIGQNLHIIRFKNEVFLFRLIQSQPQSGAASTEAGKDNAHRLAFVLLSFQKARQFRDGGIGHVYE